MTIPLTIEGTIHFKQSQRGARKRIYQGEAPEPMPHPVGRIPRVARIMALAIRFNQLVRDGHVADYAELARLAHVTRARMTQIMNLLMLAPNIQEEILFLPRVESGRDPIRLGQLQPIALVPDWRKQRHLWSEIKPS